MRKFIHLIADYGKSDPAFTEVIHRLKHHDPSVDVCPTSVPSFSTIATGFWIEQLGVNSPRIENLTIYSNTAPRKRTENLLIDESGGNLCYVKLDNNVPVLAVDTGYNLSFVKDNVSELHEVHIPRTPSQFRSRDFFPEKVIEIANNDFSSVGQEKSLSDIPDRPTKTVCHVDGYGNIKTSMRASEFAPDNDTISVTINEISRTVTVAESVFDAPKNEFTLAPGSAGGNDPYLELVYRGESASAKFNHVRPGDQLHLT